MIANVFRLLVITTGLVLLWQAVVWVAAPPPLKSVAYQPEPLS